MLIKWNHQIVFWVLQEEDFLFQWGDVEKIENSQLIQHLSIIRTLLLHLHLEKIIKSFPNKLEFNVVQSERLFIQDSYQSSLQNLLHT